MQVLLLTVLALAPLQGDDAATSPWSSRKAEHLLNRAGFGASTAEVQRWAEAGQTALVEHLLASAGPAPAWEYQARIPDFDSVRAMEQEKRVRLIQQVRQQMTREAIDFVAEWLEGMVRGEDPLRDRMRLFWHGLFTSAQTTVKRGDYMIRQAELIDRHALGNYGALLREMLEDPAMLVYLDNISNRRRKPNENLAREVMELFSLGEGHYTEEDVREAARALTGYGVGRSQEPGGAFQFLPKDHDFGRKTILGQSGRFDADDLVEVLLAQEACAEWIAGRLLEWFEGSEPAAERRAAYAALLRRSNYEVLPVLRALFMDPAFYSDDLIGARIQSPVDFMVGSARRLGITPVGEFLGVSASVLGERIFDPPNVKGWEGGMAWINTSSLMMRGNLTGVVLGLVDLGDLGADEELDAMMADEGMDASMEGMQSMEGEGRRRAQIAPDLVRAMRALRSGMGGRRRFTPPATQLRRTLALRRPAGDEELVERALEELLAIVPPLETRAPLVAFLRQAREAEGLPEEAFLVRGGQRAEAILRQLAHLILSLPEAQLG